MAIEIPNYQLLKRIGAGAFAEVWLAEHLHNRRKAAIKILKDSVETGSDAEKLFLREGEVLASFDHPNIVRIFDNAKVGEHAYLVMEFLAGGSLGERMSQRGVEVGEAIGYVVQVAGALDAAHERDIVHRDLKPANIMLRNDTTPVLTDFGASRLLKRSTIFGRDGGVIGTPQYMSPEQIRGDPLDGRSDLYALGIMFQELLTGRVPFEGTVTEVVTMHLAATPRRLPPQQGVLQPILDRLLAKEREQRFASGLALCDELRRSFLDQDTLRQLVQVAPASAWSSQLRALGFQLDTERRNAVRIAQGEHLMQQLPPAPVVATPMPPHAPPRTAPAPAVLPPPPPAPSPRIDPAAAALSQPQPAYIPMPAYTPPPTTPVTAVPPSAGVLSRAVRVLAYGIAAMTLAGAAVGQKPDLMLDFMTVSFAVLAAFQWVVARNAAQNARPILRVFAWICFAPAVLATIVCVAASEGRPFTESGAYYALPISVLASLATGCALLTLVRPWLGIPAILGLLILGGVVGSDSEAQDTRQVASVLTWLLCAALWILVGLFADLRRRR